MLKTAFSTTFDNIIAMLPTAFTIGETEYDGVKTELSKEKIYSEYGALDGYEFSIIGRVADFSTVPEDRTLIIVDAVTYRILRTKTDPVDSSIRFDIGDKYAP